MLDEYTNQNQNWHQEWKTLVDKRVRPLPSDYPIPKYQLAYKAVIKGVTLVEDYDTLMEETRIHNAYNNYPEVSNNLDAMGTKFANKEWRSYHIHFFYFLYKFIYWLIINPLQRDFDEEKGQIFTECTNGNDPAGSVNTYIPLPSDDNIKECPAVFYQYTFMDYVNILYHLRLIEPNKPILQHVYDIDLTFCQLIYNPELAEVFAYLFKQYIIIEIGQVFGPRPAPSFYYLPADIQHIVLVTLPVEPPESLKLLINSCKMILRQ